MEPIDGLVNKMKKFDLVVIYDVRSAVRVEANSEEEALAIAYKKFRPYCDGGAWETYEQEGYVCDVKDGE